MKEEAWDALMARARHEARVNLKRRRVVAVIVSDRTARRTGSRYAYVVQCGPGCSLCDSRREQAR